MPRPERARRRRASESSLDVARDGPERSRTVEGPGTLFVVATPIGNLEDITLRALRVLREVALVAAEDTRRTANLLRHYEIRTPLISLHAHNERQRTPGVLSRLEAGHSIALVTDAGTPGISDPGVHVVAAARARGFRVEPIPGPSSVVAAISAAGKDAERFAFLGFPPIRSKDRKLFWKRAVDLPDFLVVLFEAPHRLAQTLSELTQYLAERPIIVARELTKAHEEILGGTVTEVSAQLRSPLGEITILICPILSIKDDKTVGRSASDAEIGALFGQLTNNGASTRRDLIRLVAEKVGLAPKEVYQALERLKSIG